MRRGTDSAFTSRRSFASHSWRRGSRGTSESSTTAKLHSSRMPQQTSERSRSARLTPPCRRHTYRLPSISRPKTDFSLTFALCLKFSWFCQLGYYYPRRDFLPLQATITARWVLLDTSTSWDRWELCSFGLLLIFYLNFHRGLSRFCTCFWELRFPSRNHQRSLDIGPWFGTCWQFLLYFCSRFCGICLP